MANQLTEQEAILARAKFVQAFNDTMVNIWAEKITLLGIIETSQLLGSVKGLVTRADGRFIEVRLSQAFLEYGIWLCDEHPFRKVALASC